MFTKSWFLLFFVCYSSYGLKCKRNSVSIGRDNKLTESIDECTGDICIAQVLTFLGDRGQGAPVQQFSYGCLTGFDVKVGCAMDSWNNTVCACNDKDFCNAKLDIKIVKAQKIEVECLVGEIKDGKLVGNGTCKGQQCQIAYAPSPNGQPGVISAGCVYDLIPTFAATGCLLFPNPQGGNDTWQCRCQTPLCNSPTSFTIPPKRTGSVKCGSGFANVNSSEPGPNQGANRTCTGDFCLLNPMGDPPVVYSKQCMSVSNGAKVKPKNYKFDLGKQSADMYICDMDMCNVDVQTAKMHLGMTHEEHQGMGHEMGHDENSTEVETINGTDTGNVTTRGIVVVKNGTTQAQVQTTGAPVVLLNGTTPTGSNDTTPSPTGGILKDNPTSTPVRATTKGASNVMASLLSIFTVSFVITRL